MTRIPFIPGEHQEIMISHIYEHARCGVWAGMGMGKTSAALYALHNLELVEPGRSLVIAPLRVARSTWPREVEKFEAFSRMGVSAIVGTEAERIAALKRDTSLHTVNYDVLPWLVEYLVSNKKPWRWSRVVADESTRLKSFRLRGGSVRAKALSKIAHQIVKRWINLTGTPSPNGLKDLWGQTWFLDKGARLGHTMRAFEDRWFYWTRPLNLGQLGKRYEIEQLPKDTAHQEITGRLSDICVSLNSADWFDVEQPIMRPVYVELPLKARAAYMDMEKEFFTELKGKPIEAVHAASKSGKCLQIASGNVWADTLAGDWVEVHDEKLQALESIVAEAAGMPVLVRYHWKPSLIRILARFKKARVLDTRKETEDAWNEGRIPILVAHAASCGHGLNLQDGGNILVDFDHWWNLEEYLQILERIGPLRQIQSGHERPVVRFQIIARDTLDELVLLRMATKRSVQDILMEALKRRKL